MNLSGTLADWTVADLLNMLRVTSKTATVHIRGHQAGSIHFAAGRVVGAGIAGDVVIDGEAGSRQSTIDALFVLSSLDQGTFELATFEGPDGDGWEVESLLEDMHRLETLEAEMAASEIAEGPLMLREDMDEAVTIEADDWWAVASLVSVLSLTQLEEVFGRARAIRLLHTLWRLELVEPLEQVEPVDEAEPEDLQPVEAFDSGDQTPDPEPPVDDRPEEPAITPVPGDDAWLDEIAAAAGAEIPTTPEERRRLLGVAAPASTVLTGSVLDEMRRLRGRAGEGS